MEGRKAISLIILVLSASFFCVALSTIPENARGKTLHVGGSSNYTSIQPAIDDAEPGDTILVQSGTYTELLTIDKTLTLKGDGKDTTKIDGNDMGDVVNITANWVNITGFTITNSGSNSFGAGIVLHHANHCLIAHNNASGNYWSGIVLVESSHNIISNNEFSWEWGIGPHLRGVGMYLVSSDNNTITNNHASHNFEGILDMSSEGNSYTHNIVTGNKYGIATKSRDGVIAYNILSENGYSGILLPVAENVSVFGNSIIRCGFGLVLGWANDTIIYHNSFVDNGEQADDARGTGKWDNGFPSGGNYWSDHDAFDEKKGPKQNLIGQDGIGDSAYKIYQYERGPVTNEDRYPLMSPFVAPPISADNHRPFCNVTTPSIGDTVSGFVKIKGTAFDSDGEIEFVEIRVSGHPWVKADGAGEWEYSWYSRTVENGELTVYARSFDGESYSNEATISVRVENPLPSDAGLDWFWAVNGAIVIIIIHAVALVAIRARKSG